MVGAGAAGLSCSWALAGEHDVVCYEALGVIGGNGRTERIEIDGRPVEVTPGASFFPPAMNDLVLRLMRLVDTPLEPLPTQFTLCDEQGRVRYLTPSLRPLRLNGLVRRGAASDLSGWTRLLLAGRRLARAGDWMTTWGELRTTLSLPLSFLEEVADPVLASLWGVTIEDALGLSARAALGPAVPQQPSLRMREQRPYLVTGGTGRWLQQLVDHAGPNLTVVTAEPVREVTAVGDGTGTGRSFRVATEGGSDDFDRVVIASPPWAAAEMAGSLLSEAATAALASLPATPCTIAVHSDATFRPARRSEWSVVSMVTGPGRAQLTTATDTLAGEDLYRSWVTWSERPPEPCHATFSFRHVRPDPVLFDVQRKLPGWQADAGIGFAGSWVAGWDCHETAVTAGINAAAEIDPSSRRVAELRRRS